MIALHPLAVALGHLGHGLVSGAAVVASTVREEPVDEVADDGDKEVDQRPDELRGGSAVGLEDLDYTPSLVSTQSASFLA